MMTLLQTCIGLALLYFLASLLVGALIEYIAAVFKLRSRLLKQALDKMLGKAEVVLDYELVKAATPQQVAPEGGKLSGGAKSLQAVSNVFSGSSSAPSYVAPALFASAVLDRADQTPQATKLVALLSAAPSVQQGGVAALGQELEGWYNEAMKRWEGVYTRWTQAISLLICLLLVPLMNIDTVQVAKYLWVTPEARAAVAQKASEVIKANEPTNNATTNKGNASAQTTTPASAENDATSAAVKQQAVTQAQRAIDDLNLPLGWKDGLSWQKFGQGWQAGLVGWLLSIVAIAAGSRFWFDMLSRLVNLRLTGPPPETGPAKS